MPHSDGITSLFWHFSIIMNKKKNSFTWTTPQIANQLWSDSLFRLHPPPCVSLLSAKGPLNPQQIGPMSSPPFNSKKYKWASKNTCSVVLWSRWRSHDSTDQTTEFIIEYRGPCGGQMHHLRVFLWLQLSDSHVMWTCEPPILLWSLCSVL